MIKIEMICPKIGGFDDFCNTLILKFPLGRAKSLTLKGFWFISDAEDLL